MSRRKRRRGPNDGGTIDQRPGGRWRVRVRVDGRQVAYGTYETEDEAFTAQARWRLTGLLPADDPELVLEQPTSVAVGGVRCDEWFARWQQMKSGRRSLVRVGKKRAGRPRPRRATGPNGTVGGDLPSAIGCRKPSTSRT